MVEDSNPGFPGAREVRSCARDSTNRSKKAIHPVALIPRVQPASDAPGTCLRRRWTLARRAAASPADPQLQDRLSDPFGHADLLGPGQVLARSLPARLPIQ